MLVPRFPVSFVTPEPEMSLAKLECEQLCLDYRNEDNFMGNREKKATGSLWFWEKSHSAHLDCE